MTAKLAAAAHVFSAVRCRFGSSVKVAGLQVFVKDVSIRGFKNFPVTFHESLSGSKHETYTLP